MTHDTTNTKNGKFTACKQEIFYSPIPKHLVKGHILSIQFTVSKSQEEFDGTYIIS